MTKRVGGRDRRDRINQLGERDGWVCFYCRVGLKKGGRATTLDEWFPICRGGMPRIENQVLACHPCNQDKGDMTGNEYLAKLDGRSSRSYLRWREASERHQRLRS